MFVFCKPLRTIVLDQIYYLIGQSFRSFSPPKHIFHQQFTIPPHPRLEGRRTAHNHTLQSVCVSDVSDKCFSPYFWPHSLPVCLGTLFGNFSSVRVQSDAKIIHLISFAEHKTRKQLCVTAVSLIFGITANRHSNRL